MAMEDKKDNKVDTSRNGRPFSFTTGDGEDFIIDLPESIPGEDRGDYDTDDVKAQMLMDEMDATDKKIDDLLKSIGIDDIEKFNK